MGRKYQFGRKVFPFTAKAQHDFEYKASADSGYSSTEVYPEKVGRKKYRNELHGAAERGNLDRVKRLVKQGVPLKESDWKINEVRSLAVKFTRANPCCIRVIPYENDDTQSVTVCLYVDTDGNGIPHDIKYAAEKEFFNCEIECVDLHRRPLGEIVTRLPSCRRHKGKEIFDLSRKIEFNLHVFENRLNVTAVCASYKVVDEVEKEIPCVTVFVLGKGKIPAKETNIHKIREDYGHLFDYAEFDVVEGYYRPAYGPCFQMEYAFPLRCGVGIGVNGIPGAGTLGGFLEDENGECYILSCDHVLNPPKFTDNSSSDDGPSGVVDDAGISVDLSEPKSRPVCNIIEQPAKNDYTKMQKEAKKDHDNIMAEYSDVANLSQTEKNNLKRNSEYLKRRSQRFEMKNSRAQQKLQKIEERKPRQIGQYVDGLKGNVNMDCDNETYSLYVDAAIAKLDKEELECIIQEKNDNRTNLCPLYGFNKIKNVEPTGEIVDLDTFVNEIREDLEKEPEEKLTFWKIGRKTGLTDNGFVNASFQVLFVRNFHGHQKLLTSAMVHTPCQYCIKCKPCDISEAELVKAKYDKIKCSRCDKKLKQDEVYSFWQHNCFVIRKQERPFMEKGDSGSLVFDNHGRLGFDTCRLLCLQRCCAYLGLTP